MANQEHTDNKEMKRNSYETSKKIEETVHLDQAPEAHSFGHQVTEDGE
ncbi:hypothetical protein [Peribacillus deserti]|nr:hypothetical protein [Peribacillus deserti]